jgi:hypothetical protein
MVLSSRELVYKINGILNGYDYNIHETNAFSSLNLMEFVVNKLNNKEDFELSFLVRKKTLIKDNNIHNIQANHDKIPRISISLKQFNIRYFSDNLWLIDEIKYG